MDFLLGEGEGEVVLGDDLVMTGEFLLGVVFFFLGSVSSSEGESNFLLEGLLWESVIDEDVSIKSIFL